MATYLVGCLFYFAPQAVNAEVLPPQSLGILLVAIMAYTFVIPVLFVYGLQQLRMIQSLMLQTLEERRLPLWITVMVYAAATYFFGWKFIHLGAISTVLSVILGSITVSILLLSLISLYWQISAHMTGIGGVVGFLLAVVYLSGDPRLATPLLMAVLASGWIASARMQLNAHTTEEISAGFVLGMLVCGAGALIFL